jgi:hypothetical protein
MMDLVMGEQMGTWQTVFEVGAEGGSIALYAIHNGKQWQYSNEIIDQTLQMMDEEVIHHKSPVVYSWKDAMLLVAKYPWHNLYPLEVHPQFRGAVLAEVVSRFRQEEDLTAHRLDKWLHLCGQAPD